MARIGPFRAASSSSAIEPRQHHRSVGQICDGAQQFRRCRNATGRTGRDDRPRPADFRHPFRECRRSARLRRAELMCPRRPDLRPFGVEQSQETAYPVPQCAAKRTRHAPLVEQFGKLRPASRLHPSRRRGSRPTPRPARNISRAAARCAAASDHRRQQSVRRIGAMPGGRSSASASNRELVFLGVAQRLELRQQRRAAQHREGVAGARGAPRRQIDGGIRECERRRRPSRAIKSAGKRVGERRAGWNRKDFAATLNGPVGGRPGYLGLFHRIRACRHASTRRRSRMPYSRPLRIATSQTRLVEKVPLGAESNRRGCTICTPG